MEYTEEEKKAIEVVEKVKYIFMHLKNNGWIKDVKRDINTDEAISSIDIVLNLLERYYVYAHNYRDLCKRALDDVRKESKKNADGMKEVEPIKGFEEENIEVSKFGEWVGKNYIDYKFEYENLQRMLSDSIPKEAIRKRLKKFEKIKTGDLTPSDCEVWSVLRNLLGE